MVCWDGSCPQENGKLHICVDLKSLNPNTLREIHPPPKVDETLVRLSGAKISNWMPTVDFGKFLCLHHHTFSLLSLHQWAREDTASTSSRLVYQVPQSTLETLRTDNGPQFSSQEFAEFTKQWKITC